jgi:hypothetical protein
MELRGTLLIVSVILSIVTSSVSWAARKPASPAPKPTPTSKARPITQAPPVILSPKFDPALARGKYLAARPAAQAGQWIVAFDPLEKGKILDASKSLIISTETNAGASAAPTEIFKQQWNAKTQSFVVTYSPGKTKGPAELRIKGAFTICDPARKACQKVLEDFQFDPLSAGTSDKAPPSAAKTLQAP